MDSVIAYVPAVGHTLSGHPENAGRMQAIMHLLERKGVIADLSPLDPQYASVEQLGRVHEPSLIERVHRASLEGGGHLDADTYSTAESYDLARLAAGSVCAAVDEIMAGRARNGIALVRPPGHHADSRRVGGFCLFNNVAVAARHAQASWGAKRVLIVDFDVHHGNGTQDIFYLDPSVLFISLHLFHPFFYPGTGAPVEIGEGAGLGLTVNVPFGPGVGDEGYELAFKELIETKATAFRPEIILVSAGFDAHWVDPLASAQLTLSGYAWLAREIIRLAESLCSGQVLFVLEGGYHPDALSYGVLNAIYALTGRDLVEDPIGTAPVPERDVTNLLLELQRLHLPN